MDVLVGVDFVVIVIVIGIVLSVLVVVSVVAVMVLFVDGMFQSDKTFIQGLAVIKTSLCHINLSFLLPPGLVRPQ